MEGLFNFPRLYRLKMWIVNNVFKFIEPHVMKNQFRFEDVLQKIIPQNSSVFEIGCGDGILYQKLVSLNKNITYIGSDINDSMIKFCKSKFPEADWYTFDSLPYPFPDNYFDFCIIENVLHHLNSYETICGLLKEAMRIGRRVVFFEPLQSDNILLRALKSLYWSITDGGKFYFTHSEFHTLFKDTGARLKWEKTTEPLHQIYSCEVIRVESVS